jgi:hypothetical protein
MASAETNAGRMILIWMFFVSSLLSQFVREGNIFRFGPSTDLTILEVKIDTGARYTMVLIFCLINSCMRTINSTMLHSWITNTVQDKTNLNYIVPNKAYLLSSINSAYVWFDFFMYMNILMAQIDLFLAEVLADLIITAIVTRHYLGQKRADYTLI